MRNELSQLNIVVPMAGAGSRFAQAGFTVPKPLIPVHGVPMIQVVIDNIAPTRAHRFIFVCQAEHVVDYDLENKLRLWAPNCEIVEVDGLTEGAASTVLKAESFIGHDDELMIANSDQFVDLNIDQYLSVQDQPEVAGLIMTMTATDPKWSFVRLDETGKVTSVVEKVAVSDQATVGIYNFSRGADFLAAAHEMVDRKLKVNGEYYVAPVYNLMIERGAVVLPRNVGTVGDGMYGLGTPVDLEAFLETDVSRSVVAGLRADS